MDIFKITAKNNILDFVFIFLLLILEKGKGGRQSSMWERNIGCLLHTPWPGTESATQACALTRHRTSNLSVCGMTPNQFSHTGQVLNFVFFSQFIYIKMLYLFYTNFYISWHKANIYKTSIELTSGFLTLFFIMYKLFFH